MRALRTTTRVTATLTAAGVMALAAGPAFAADTTVVAQSEAEAISLSIAGNSVTDPLGGPYRVERTSSGETAEGNNDPQASAITRQTAINFGLLAQDAQTGLAGDRGISEACSGVAGDGATVIGVGNDGDCFEPNGSGASLKLGALDLQQLKQVRLIDEAPSSLEDLIEQLPTDLQDPFNNGIRQINNALRSALTPLGNPGLSLKFDTIQSQCEAGPGNVASGSSDLTNVSASLEFPAGAGVPGEFDVLGPVQTKPKPNTSITTDFDEVVDAVARALAKGLAESDLGSDDLNDAVDEIREQIRQNLTGAIADQLGELDQVISGTLNKQERSSGAIEVTAIDAAILPAIAEQTGFNLVDVAIARSQCGPGATLTDTPTTPTDPDSPDVPRVVPAGVGTPLDGVAARGNDATVPAALALLALMTFGSAVGFSTSRSRANA